MTTLALAPARTAVLAAAPPSRWRPARPPRPARCLPWSRERARARPTSPSTIAGPVTVTFREITIEPGAGTGLHCHDGNLIAVVKQGVLTHYAPIYPTGVHEYRAGDAIIEGAHYLHEGKNEGTEPVVLEVTYVIPEGFPLAETDPAKCDPAGTI